MATVSTTPGTLNIVVKRGDDFDQLLDFSINLTGYTFTSEIVSAVTYAEIASPSVTAVDLSLGRINLAMSDTMTAGIAPGSYLWRLIWQAPGNVRRTALEGVLEVVR